MHPPDGLAALRAVACFQANKVCGDAQTWGQGTTSNQPELSPHMYGVSGDSADLQICIAGATRHFSGGAKKTNKRCDYAGCSSSVCP